MVGLSLANQLKNNFNDLSITVLEKEDFIGLHSSGRNSGVLHAGIYYEPNSIRAKVCVEGSKRLKEWCEENKVEINKCGKVITPQSIKLDNQLDLLLKRAESNNAEAYLIDHNEFKKLVPDGRTASGRALWSPNTSVVNPKSVLNKLLENLHKKGVRFIFGSEFLEANINKKNLKFISKKESFFVEYGHVFNCSGLHADRVAKFFNVGKNLKLLPFKGLYYSLKKNTPFQFKTNLYPVPDLNLPFLGVHVTPSTDGSVTFGPTAIPAFGRENYDGINNFEPLMTVNFAITLLDQWIKNKNGFQQYARDQALHGFKSFFLKSAQEIVPNLRSEHISRSKKVGIRAQLYDTEKRLLINDFVQEEGINSTHILNAISPAFTASFAFADLILSKSCFNS